MISWLCIAASVVAVTAAQRCTGVWRKMGVIKWLCIAVSVIAVTAAQRCTAVWRKMGVIKWLCIAAAVVAVTAIVQQGVSCTEVIGVGGTGTVENATTIAVASATRQEVAEARSNASVVGRRSEAKRVAEEAAATAREKEAEAKRQVSVVSTREETKADVVRSRKQPVYRTERHWIPEDSRFGSTEGVYATMRVLDHEDTFVTKQKYGRRVHVLGSGMEVFGEWLKVGAPWEERA